MATIQPAPLQTPVVERDGLITRTWHGYLLALASRVQTAAITLVSLALTAQSASIATTAIVPLPASGRYRVSFHARVTSPASGSSSIVPVVSYTMDGVACTQSGAALVSNAVNAPGSWTFVVKADAATPISYGVTYLSVGTVMAYALDVVLESLS